MTGRNILVCTNEKINVYMKCCDFVVNQIWQMRCVLYDHSVVTFITSIKFDKYKKLSRYRLSCEEQQKFCNDVLPPKSFILEIIILLHNSQCIKFYYKTLFMNLFVKCTSMPGKWNISKQFDSSLILENSYYWILLACHRILYLTIKYNPAFLMIYFDFIF